MEWLSALVAADVTKLALLALICVCAVLALPHVVRLRRDTGRAGDEVPERYRKYIDERAQHKANSAVAPLAGKLSDLEEDMSQQKSQIKSLSDKAIEADLEIGHVRGDIADVKAGNDRIRASQDDQSGKLNRILGHLGIS